MAVTKSTATESSTPRRRAPACPRLLVSVTRLVIRKPANSGANPAAPASAPSTIATAMSHFLLDRQAHKYASYQADSYDNGTSRSADGRLQNLQNLGEWKNKPAKNCIARGTVTETVYLQAKGQERDRWRVMAHLRQEGVSITRPDTPVPYLIPLSRLQVEHAQLHAGFLEHGHGQLVRYGFW